ncbi:MAG: hypothetical protein E7316_07405 [Clostridiales bacterium]|nr:hypothetical protein [Clostridiales bacterium]
MKLFRAMGAAARVYFSKFFEGALCVLFQLVLRLIVAAPLLSLVTTEIRWLALLSIPLYLLIIPVARQNMAEAMQDAIGGGPLMSVKLVSMEDYGRKFRRGLKQAILLALWALPFIAATVVAVWAYKGQVDVATLLRVLMQLGGGSFMEGVKRVLMIYAATLLPIVLGCAFHSGARHAIALERGKLSWFRPGVVLAWFVGLVALVPFAVAVYRIGADFVSALVNALSSLSFDSIALPSIGDKAYTLAIAFVLLFLPLLPFKQLLTAAYVRELKQ